MDMPDDMFPEDGPEDHSPLREQMVKYLLHLSNVLNMQIPYLVVALASQQQ